MVYNIVYTKEREKTMVTHRFLSLRAAVPFSSPSPAYINKQNNSQKRQRIFQTKENGNYKYKICLNKNKKFKKIKDIFKEGEDTMVEI